MNNTTIFKIPLSLCFIFGFLNPSLAQKANLSGVVLDDYNQPLAGATIEDIHSGKGIDTDKEGRYSLTLDPGTYIFEVRYVGFESQQSSMINLAKDSTVILNFTLLEKEQMMEALVITGSIIENRSNLNTTAPIDIIKVNESLDHLPQTTLNQLLHFTAPSFSSNTQVISDGTDHVDPASLRGLGPDQVLVLMNGKRRHTSSLINVNGTFGRGNVGTDMNAIPAAAVETIEVLRDGASAQYGSDAIAGVINIRLRETVNELRFAVNTGANFTKNSSPEKKVDGGVVEISANYGIPLGNNNGFLNLTGAFNYRGWTNRMQRYTGTIFNGYNAIERVAFDNDEDISKLSIDDIQTYAQNVTYFSPELKQLINDDIDIDSLGNLLTVDVTDEELAIRGQTRADYNMRVGQSKLRGGKFFANMSLPMGKGMELYGFGGISYREGNSGCFYRLPHESRTYTPIYLNGHIPEINSKIGDKSLALGIKGDVDNWNVDLSNTFGTNQFLFYITETANATLGNASPTTFDSGGHAFTQNTGNLDVSQYFDLNRTTNAGVGVAFGGEYRYENFRIIQGTETSHGNYDVNGNLVNSLTPNDWLTTNFYNESRPSGAQCFAGFLPSNEANTNRSSVSLYVNTEWDIDPSFLLSAATRFENYSDFGSTFNYKLATRYKLNKVLNLRAAHSTGFRAPSLHQIHFSRTSTIFETEGGTTTAQEVGVFSNTSRAAELLGIPALKEERSRNYSLGFTGRLPARNLKFTIDAYQINIKDRIVLTGDFEPGNDLELQQIFAQVQATRAAFFANAIDTKSRGLDLVLTHKITLNNKSKSEIENDFALTFSRTRAVRDSRGNVIVKSSEALRKEDLENTYFDETNQQYLEKAVPRTKLTLSHRYTSGDWSIYLRNTYFGSTEEAANISELSPSVDYVYGGKIITDLTFGYKITKHWNVTIGANNLLDVYPDQVDPAFQADGRFIYSRRSPQFNYGGRHLFARLIFRLKDGE